MSLMDFLGTQNTLPKSTKSAQAATDSPRSTSTKRAWYGWLPNRIAAPLRVETWKIEDAGWTVLDVDKKLNIYKKIANAV